jgi:hypothetical protein
VITHVSILFRLTAGNEFLRGNVVCMGNPVQSGGDLSRAVRMDYARARSWAPQLVLCGVAFVVTLWVNRPAGVAPLAAQSQAPPGQQMQPPEQLLSQQELEDRSWAISALAAAPSEASVQALAHVLESSGDYRERLEAVSALHHMASSAASADSVRKVLKRATTDRNAEVAARARLALQRG